MLFIKSSLSPGIMGPQDGGDLCTDLYHFYLDTVLPIQIVFFLRSCRWAESADLSKWRQVPLNSVEALLFRYVDISTWQIRSYRSKTNYF